MFAARFAKSRGENSEPQLFMAAIGFGQGEGIKRTPYSCS